MNPGIYICAEPFRLVMVAEYADEMRAIEVPMSPEQADALATLLVQSATLERLKQHPSNPQCFDAAFARQAGNLVVTISPNSFKGVS